MRTHRIHTRLGSLMLIWAIVVLLTGALWMPGAGKAYAASQAELMDNANDRLIDNSGAETVPGQWVSSTFRAGFEGSDYLYALQGPGDKTITWRPNLPISGKYNVYYRLPDGLVNTSDVASNAVYTIQHAKGTTAVTVNQRAAGGDYMLLGQFSFAAGTNGYVQLNNQVDAKYVLADAVIFDWVAPGSEQAAGGEPIIIDNTDVAAADLVGTWNAGTTRTNKYGSNYLATGKGTGAKTVTWRFDIPTDGNYGVYFWVPDSLATDTSIANDAPYTVKYALGVSTVTASQRGNGGKWTKLGSFRFSAGADAYVQLSDNIAAGNVMADAIKVVYEPGSGEIIIDNGAAAQVHEGVGNGWETSSGRAGAYGGSYLRSSNDLNTVGQNKLVWTPFIETAGYYNVYYQLPNGSQDSGSLASNAPYTIHSADGDTVVKVNERQANSAWMLLGTFRFDAGSSGNVSVSNSADGIVMADAVRFLQLDTLADDASPIVTKTGDWSGSTAQPNYYGTGYAVSPGGQGENAVVWKPQINKSGYYSVSIWHPDAAVVGATNAKVTVADGGGTTDSTVDFQTGGQMWYPLGVYYFNEGNAGEVRMNNQANGEVYVDAIRFTYTGANLFYDDFSKDNAAWNTTGSWQRTSVGYEGLWTADASGANPATALTGSSQWGHYSAAVEATPQSLSGEFGVIVRGQSDGSRYVARYNAVSQKFELVKQSGGADTVLAQSDVSVLTANQPVALSVHARGPILSLYVNGQFKVQTELSLTDAFLSGQAGMYAKGVKAAFRNFGVGEIQGPPIDSGTYTITDTAEQTIKGLGFEIQSDSIGSANLGLPQDTIGVPHDLVPSERTRLAEEMLQGFRYMRLAGGLYYRGLDEQQKQLKERWPEQLQELSDLITQANLEGVDFEYWSPTPFYKTNGSYIGGILKSQVRVDPATDTAIPDSAPASVYGSVYKPSYPYFAESVWKDLKYLMDHGVPVVQFGLQNEAENNYTNTTIPDASGALHPLPYSHSPYSPQLYLNTMQSVAPLLKEKFAELGKPLEIHADSWEAQHGGVGQALKSDPNVINLIDAWTIHRIGWDSNTVISEASFYKDGTLGKPIYQNEFEYFSNQVNGWNFVNTAQSVLNWFTFADSPTWYWLHALKPLYNSEAAGYSLGFWRASDDDSVDETGPYANVEKGHWVYNNENWNALAGFLKYLPWDSIRYEVQEPKAAAELGDNRIMAWKAPAVKNSLNSESLLQPGKMGLAVTNRSEEGYYTYKVNVGAGKTYKGYLYTEADAGVDSQGVEVGTVTTTTENPYISTTLHGYAIEFWVEQ